VNILVSKGKLIDGDSLISKTKKQVVKFLSGYKVEFYDYLKEGLQYDCLLVLDSFSRSDKTLYAIVNRIPILRPQFFMDRRSGPVFS